MTAPARAFEPVAFLAGARPAVEAALERLIAGIHDGDAVAEAARYALGGEGKRLRPILFAAAYRAVAGAPAGAGVHDMGVALEVVHTYSLVHDDLPCMDDDALRRGRPTVHRIYGGRSAALAGAALIPLAAMRLSTAAAELGLDAGRGARLVAELMAAAGAGGMVGGQHLDLAAEGGTPGLEGLGAIHARKTGALLAAAARMGGIAAGADDASVEGLGRYGQALGLAFQIADDILDVTGETAVLGKEAGRDSAHEKATYPAILGLDAARQRAREAAAAAVEALRRAGVRSVELEGLARFAAERDR